MTDNSLADPTAKARAALEVLSGKTEEEVARELGVDRNRVAEWVSHLRESASSLFETDRRGGSRKDIRGYRSLLDSISRNVQEAVLRSTPEEGLVYVNDAFLKMFGYDTKEEVMETQPESFYADPEKRWEILEKLQGEGHISNSEVRFRRRDGSEFWGMENSILVEDEKGVFIDAIIHDITERKRFESRIKSSLKEKEVLLGEIHHRVKNNLAIISGLLYLQVEKAEDDRARDLLTQSQSRINSMAMVHEMLYDNKTFSRIEPGRYVRELVEYISENLATSDKEVDVEVDAGDIQLNMNIAVPCALILNELLTNAFKHAFRGRDAGKIYVCFDREGDRFLLLVRDNGVGIPPRVLGDREGEHTLGLLLVRTLVDQIDGELDVTSGEEGTEFRIRFPG